MAGRAFLSSLAVGSRFLCDRVCSGWYRDGERIAVVHGGRKDARESQMEAVKISGDDCDFFLLVAVSPLRAAHSRFRFFLSSFHWTRNRFPLRCTSVEVHL